MHIVIIFSDKNNCYNLFYYCCFYDIINYMNEETKNYFKSLLNIPNMLTMLRIFCVPFFVVFFFCFDSHIPALVVFVVASITDLFDGYLARKTNNITPVGIVLDPLADKLLKIATLFCFAYISVVPWWLFGIFCFVDVLMIISGGFLFNKKIQISSNIIGKTGTLVVSIGLFMCFFPKVFLPWCVYLLYAGFGVIFSSVILYVSLNYKNVLKVLIEDKNEQKQDGVNQKGEQKDA